VSTRRSLLFAVALLSVSGSLYAAWGTTNDTLVTISAWDFEPLNSSMTTSNGVAAAPVMRFMTPDGGELLAGVALPTGALIESITINSCNTNPTLNINISLLQLTDPSGPVATIAFGSVPANSGCGSTSFSPPNPLVVDNNGFTYILDISMQSGDETLAFRSVKFAYRLQVSPAPAVPTFSDVPVSDFGFQYIEALAATGITGGCGGGNFCPDNPLTRRQAAIFLARALGLNFPN
jgi:hypothetical protein